MTDVIDCNYLNSEEGRLEENSELIESIMEILREDFSKQTRTELVSVAVGEEEFDIRLNDLLFSLVLAETRFWPTSVYEFSKESFLFDITNPKKVMKAYLDETLEVLIPAVNVKDVTKVIGKVLERIVKIAWEINYFKGNSVNLYDLLTLAAGNQEVLDILNHVSNENQQFSEIESSVEAKTKRLTEILKSDDTDTCLKNMLDSVSSKQFQQAFVNISLKPDLYGSVIERPINTSFLRGMRDSTDYFVNAVGARKALIVNATQVRSAGYLSRKLALLIIATGLAEDVDDCGPRRLLPITIDNEDMAKRFTNRYYKLKESDKKFKCTTNTNSTLKLVGKTIYLASPITCNLSNSNKVCRCCYGRLSDINQFHVGLSAILILTEQFLQMLLSSKHLLQVIADHIELPEGFADYFSVDKNDLIATGECKVTITGSVFDEFTNTDVISKLSVQDEANDVFHEIHLSDLEMSLNPSALERINSDGEITVKAGDEVFRLDIENNELSAPLKRLLKIIESNNELNAKNGISELLSELLTLLINSDIKQASVGMELLVRELARNPDDLHEKSSDDNAVEFLRLTSAIIHSSSASVSLAFEQHNKLLEGILFKKNESSPLDLIF